MISSTDRIVKRVFLPAPQERVWRAISESRQFGAWFGMQIDGEFAAGQPITGTIVPTKADLEVAKRQEKYAGKKFGFIVDRIEPMGLFSFRWHPYAMDPNHDYSKEQTTLVEFILEPKEGGTELTIVESGFDSIPIERRAAAFEANDEGWGLQAQLIAKYLAMPA
ncbi:MAG TPA: SRPBCC family protein [Candidatus Aquilonibacter sp.]